MRVILRQVPTIEAWLIRFDGWWGARSRREQVMLGVLGALVLGIILVFGVIKPLQAARAAAIADIRTYETYNARLRAAGRLAPSAPARTGPPQTMVGDSAIAQGLAANVEPIPGGVRATVADGSYDAVIAWIADVGATTRLSVRRVSVQRRQGPGRVSATVEFGS
jgi:general secretion pathway protein M